MFSSALFCLLLAAATAKPAADAEPAANPQWNNLQWFDQDWTFQQTAGTRQRSGFTPYIQRSGVNYLALPDINIDKIDVNIVRDTRQTADNAITILKSLKDDAQAAPLVEKVLNTLSCLNTLDDVIETVEAAARLVENNGPELVYLTAIFEKLQGERDIVVTIRSSAKMLRVLQVLRNHFTPEAAVA